MRFACAMNFLEGRKYSSSFQWTAICASVGLCFSFDAFATFLPRALGTAATPFGSSEFGYDATARDKMMLPRRRASQSGRERVESGAGTVIHNTIEPAHGHFPVFRGSSRRGDQCRRRGREFCLLSRLAIYGCACHSGERDEYAGAMDRHDGERRGLPGKAEHYAAGHDSAGDYQRHRRSRGRILID